MNQRTILLVDAYNVINAWSELNTMLDDDLEGARERLNDYMYEYAAYYGEEVYVVYDAYARKGKLENVETVNQIHIVYTKENQTADAYIEKKVKELSADVRLLIKVVTSDWVQQRQIMGSGGIRLTPWELKEKCDRIRNRVKRKVAQNTSESPKGRTTLEKLGHLFDKSQK